ncbi:MAG TPA: sugar ABC transporter permease [Gemmatimonadales bacterium]|nr:sugar ABC transporter permease [Gemmatimonadales bacterium]
MKRLGRHVAGALVMGIAALAALAAARLVIHRAEIATAERSAKSAAAYLALVTPTEAHSTSYQLVQLLAQARGIGTLPGWAGVVEVYAGNATLVHATAQPLAQATLDELRERDVPLLSGGEVVVPLKDKDGWDGVGAVAVRVVSTDDAILGGWGLVLVIVLAAAGAAVPSLGRPALGACVLGAVLVGSAAYARVVAGEAAATDRWLARTRLLLGEASSRLYWTGAASTAQRLAPLARGADILTDSSSTEIRRSVVNGIPRAQVMATLGPGRWLTLSMLPGETNAGGWLVVTLALALLGPIGVWLSEWLARARLHPRSFHETLTAWGFLAPATLHLAAFSFAPMVFALYLSFHRWNPIEAAQPYVGLDNFVALARDPLVWVSVRNTLLYTLHVPVAMAIALTIALLLRRSTKGALLGRLVFILPYASSVVAVALVWQWLYHPEFGVFNWVAGALGWQPVDWLGDPRTALLAVMIVSVWLQVGYQMVLFLAGLQAIPRDYVDAARVDGANAWQRFWRVTFPLLRPVTLFVLVTGIITSFQVFTLVYILTGGGPLHATDMIVLRIYRMAWELLQFGGASALSLVLFVLLFAATWIQFRLLGRRVEYA